MTGFGLGPVQRSKKGDEEPFTLSETASGKELLNAAIKAGIPYPSPQFYVWINALEQRKTFLSAIDEHNDKKLAGRRLLGGTSADWYQLFVTSVPVDLASATRFGNNPFDNDRKGPRGSLWAARPCENLRRGLCGETRECRFQGGCLRLESRRREFWRS